MLFRSVEVQGVYQQAENDLNFDPSDYEMSCMVTAIKNEAAAWFDNDGDHWGSFRHLCHITGRDPDAERERLLVGEEYD